MPTISSFNAMRQPIVHSEYKGQLPVPDEDEHSSHDAISVNSASDLNSGMRQSQRHPRIQEGPPNPSLLQIFANALPGKFLRHQFIKGLTVTLALVGIAAGSDVLGYDRVIIAIVGSVVWGFSTALSISVRPPGRRAMDTLAESIGYGVAGVVIYPAELMADCMGYGEYSYPTTSDFRAI